MCLTTCFLPQACYLLAWPFGFIAGLLLVAYTALAVVRSAQYYWIHKKTSAYAATPLAFCAVFILVVDDNLHNHHMVSAPFLHTCP